MCHHSCAWITTAVFQLILPSKFHAHHTYVTRRLRQKWVYPGSRSEVTLFCLPPPFALLFSRSTQISFPTSLTLLHSSFALVLCQCGRIFSYAADQRSLSGSQRMERGGIIDASKQEEEKLFDVRLLVTCASIGAVSKWKPLLDRLEHFSWMDSPSKFGTKHYSMRVYPVYSVYRVYSNRVLCASALNGVEWIVNEEIYALK